MKFQTLVTYLFGIFLTGLLGCSSMHSRGQAVEYYHLEYSSPASLVTQPLPVVIQVDSFNAIPPYNSSRIFFSKTKFNQNKYIYHKWISNPADMVSYFIARDLRNLNIVSGVFMHTEYGATHRLAGTLESFNEQDLKDVWNAVLSLTVTLIKENESDDCKRICLQKTYTETQPCESKNPQSLAKAMSYAMAQVSERVISDIYKVLSQKSL